LFELKHGTPVPAIPFLSPQWSGLADRNFVARKVFLDIFALSKGRGTRVLAAATRRKINRDYPEPKSLQAVRSKGNFPGLIENP
jgi:hypothetical protein